MSATTVRLLQSAAEAVGGTRALARRLGIGEALLAKFMADIHPLPDSMLLVAVDIVLEDRPARAAPLAPTAAQGLQEHKGTYGA
jgi:hypothetical protein